MIIFVGDKPSTKNIDPKVPFVGTKSYKTLLDWIARLDIDISDTIIVNSNGVDKYPFSNDNNTAINFSCPATSVDYDAELDKVIALGNNAASVLNGHLLPHFKLPHPSGRNRKLNDKKYVKQVLKECKEWLCSKT